MSWNTTEDQNNISSVNSTLDIKDVLSINFSLVKDNENVYINLNKLA